MEAGRPAAAQRTVEMPTTHRVLGEARMPRSSGSNCLVKVCVATAAAAAGTGAVEAEEQLGRANAAHHALNTPCPRDWW